MAKRPQNHRADWTRQEVKALRQLAKQNAPTRVIGLKLGRTPASIHNKATREGISLKPTNQSPYGRTITLPSTTTTVSKAKIRGVVRAVAHESISGTAKSDKAK